VLNGKIHLRCGEGSPPVSRPCQPCALRKLALARAAAWRRAMQVSPDNLDRLSAACLVIDALGPRVSERGGVTELGGRSGDLAAAAGAGWGTAGAGAMGGWTACCISVQFWKFWHVMSWSASPQHP
jgi:hypothetical protein